MKLERAVEHLKALKHESGLFMSTEPYSISEEPEVEGYWQLIRAYIREEPPIRFSVMAGDVIHNLNASLDHLVYALSVTKPLGTGFPIFADPDAYVFTSPKKRKSERDRLLGGVSDDDRAIIDAFQPYENRMKGDPLWRLREFANADKHRITAPAFAQMRGARIFYPRGCTVTYGPSRTGPFHDGAVLLRFHLECPGGLSDANVQVRAELDLSMAFSATGVDFVDITAMVERVTDVIGCF